MQILGLLLKTSIAALVFATGLKATPDDIAWLWRRPALLLKAFLAMYVAVPLALCAIVLLVALRHEVVALGLPSFLAFAGLALAGIAAGHLLGGPDPSHRTSLAVSCTTRHVGLALLIAARAPSPRVLAFVIAYVLATVLVAIPYVRWRQRAGSRPGLPAPAGR